MVVNCAIRSSGSWDPLPTRFSRPSSACNVQHDRASGEFDFAYPKMASQLEVIGEDSILPMPRLGKVKQRRAFGESNSKKSPETQDGRHASLDSANVVLSPRGASNRVQTLVEVLALGQAINRLNERADVLPALFSKMIYALQTPARAEMAPLALSILRSHELAMIAKENEKASCVLPTELQSCNERADDSAQADAAINRHDSTQGQAAANGIASPLPIIGTAKDLISKSKSSKARRFTQVFIVVASTFGCAGVGTEAVVATNDSDQKNLDMVRKSVLKKHLGTINQDYIFGHNNGGLLIPESPPLS